MDVENMEGSALQYCTNSVVWYDKRSRPRGNRIDKCGWVSLKQHKKFFEIFEESLRGFKDKWFVVRPITSKGWKTIIVRGPKVDDEGRVVPDPDGRPVEVDCERFPICWSMKHYSQEAKSFTFKKGALSKEELVDVKALEDFVDCFPANLWEDKDGNPIYDEEGRRVTSKKFINTMALLKCETRVEAEALLQHHSLSSEAPSREEEAGGRSNARRHDASEESEDRCRGSSTVRSHKLVPGRAAAEFVLPPAMGHEFLFYGKTIVKVPQADQEILRYMGPESIRNVVAESSMAVFKLLEVATFLNGRESKYLREKDEARAHAKDFGERLSVDLNDAQEREKALKEKVAGLEEKLANLSLTLAVEEEEKKLDPEGTYANSSRADLIAKIYQIGDLQLEVASSSFKNARLSFRSSIQVLS
ncbi:hypothetical protein TSUD_375570 [Trifolium subterraneum]|uniref:Uncharacterized protein n=1 Tax=Trifolium subterraneum TaxID=3900 RepID=A0A2Z6NC07_TRISU|nr:hypothetical protein TSUD_375570 [Trifolium subterraneum]